MNKNPRLSRHGRPPPWLRINQASILGWLWLWLALLNPGLALGACGDTWTLLNPLPQSNQLQAVTWSGSQFVAVGYAGTILTSPDGVNWTTRTSGTTQILRAVTWSGSQFVVVGDEGTILTSPDGVDWSTQDSGTVQLFRAVTWSGSQFVAVGLYSDSAILTSSDGVHWTI